MGETHDVKTGFNIGRNTSHTDFDYSLNGLPDRSLQSLGGQRRVQDKRLTIYLQDEWRISKNIGLNLGVSGERRRIGIVEGIYDTRSDYTLWAPSSNLSWKLSGAADKRLRVGLARTFSAPFLDQLGARPTINPFAPCGADAVSYTHLTLPTKA